MAEDTEDQIAEGLTLPADPKPSEANIAHENEMLEEHKKLVGEENFDPEREKARQEAALGGATLTEDQQKQSDEAAASDEVQQSSSISGMTSAPAEDSATPVDTHETSSPIGPSGNALDNEHATS